MSTQLTRAKGKNEKSKRMECPDDIEKNASEIGLYWERKHLVYMRWRIFLF